MVPTQNTIRLSDVANEFGISLGSSDFRLSYFLANAFPDGFNPAYATGVNSLLKFRGYLHQVFEAVFPIYENVEVFGGLQKTDLYQDGSGKYYSNSSGSYQLFSGIFDRYIGRDGDANWWHRIIVSYGIVENEYTFHNDYEPFI